MFVNEEDDIMSFKTCPSNLKICAMSKFFYYYSLLNEESLYPWCIRLLGLVCTFVFLFFCITSMLGQ